MDYFRVMPIEVPTSIYKIWSCWKKCLLCWFPDSLGYVILDIFSFEHYEQFALMSVSMNQDDQLICLISRQRTVRWKSLSHCVFAIRLFIIIQIAK